MDLIEAHGVEQQAQVGHEDGQARDGGEDEDRAPVELADLRMVFHFRALHT